jgi:hypothetical protein
MLLDQISSDGYKYSCNATRGKYHHRVFKALKRQGHPIHITDVAYDIHGGLLKECVGIHILESQIREVYAALNEATSSPFEKAIFMAECGNTSITFDLLTQSDADEAKKREVLANAYDVAASGLNRTGKRLSSKALVHEAKKRWRFARKLQGGEIPFGLMPIEPETLERQRSTLGQSWRAVPIEHSFRYPLDKF